MTSLLHSALAILHALAGAAWLGAMFYSFFLLHPRAHTYFPKPTDFEAFITAVSRGTRYPVLAALAVVGLSGVGLLLVRRPAAPVAGWLALMAAKAALFLAAVGLFGHVSWRLWPARVLALPEEIPGVQRTFRRAAAAMLVIVTLGMVLGILAHTGLPLLE